MKKIGSIVLCLWCCASSLMAQSYDEWVNRGMDAIDQKNLLEAENCFKSALKKDPTHLKNALVLANLGTVQRRLDKKKEALQSYTLSLNYTPYSIPVLLDRASLYLDLDLLDPAYTDYCQVIDLDRKNKEALQFRAYIYMRRREYSQARLDYQALLAVEPGNLTARFGRAMVLQKEKKYEAALEAMNQLIVDYPKEVAYLKARAYLEVDMMHLDMALLDLESAAKLAPADAEIYVLCGEIYLQQQKKREAYMAFEKAIELGVPRPELQDRLKAAK